MLNLFDMNPGADVVQIGSFCGGMIGVFIALVLVKQEQKKEQCGSLTYVIALNVYAVLAFAIGSMWGCLFVHSWLVGIFILLTVCITFCSDRLKIVSSPSDDEQFVSNNEEAKKN